MHSAYKEWILNSYEKINSHSEEFVLLFILCVGKPDVHTTIKLLIIFGSINKAEAIFVKHPIAHTYIFSSGY